MNDEEYFRHNVLCKLMLSIWLCVARHSQITQSNKLVIYLSLKRSEWWSCFFCMQASMKVSNKLILWFLIRIVNYSQSSKNSKFAMSLEYLQRYVRDKVDFFFLHAGKHKFSCKVILSLSIGMIKCSQSMQSNKFAISSQYLNKKKLGMMFIFCMQTNIKFLKTGIIVFNGNGQTCPKYPKQEVCNLFGILQK